MFEIESKDILQLIKTKQGQMQPLFARMDGDYNVWSLEKYTYDEGKDLTRSATSNEPRSFADYINSVIANTSMRIAVEPLKNTAVSRAEATKIEDYIRNKFWEANNRYMVQYGMTVLEAVGWYLSIRGMAGLKALIHQNKKEDSNGGLSWELWPIDGHSLVYEYGTNGLLWVAYPMSMSKYQVQDQFGQIPGLSDKPKYDTWDFWTSISNACFVDDKEVIKYSPHGLKALPIAIARMPSRPPIRGPGQNLIVTESDSIYGSLRHNYELTNEALSILLTSESMNLKVPTVDLRPGGTKIDKSFYHPGAYIKAEPLEGGVSPFQALPIRSLSPTFPMYWSILQLEKQRGSVAPVTFGQAEGTQSGRQVELLQQQAQMLVGVILRSLGYLYSTAAELFRQQFVSIGEATDIYAWSKKGHRGKIYQLNPEDLDKDVKIEIQFTTKRKTDDLVAYQMAQLAKGFISNDTIRERVLEVDDPDEEARKVILQSPTGIEEVDTILSLRDKMAAYKAEGDNENFNLCKGAVERLELALTQPMVQPTTPPVAPPLEQPTGEAPGYDEVMQMLSQEYGGR